MNSSPSSSSNSVEADEAIAELYPNNSIRLTNRDEIDSLVAETLGKMTHADAAAKLKKAEIAYGTLNDLQGFSNHSVLRRAKISSPEFEIQIPAPPAICDKNPLETLGGVPELNQHGEAIRAEFAETVSLKED